MHPTSWLALFTEGLDSKHQTANSLAPRLPALYAFRMLSVLLSVRIRGAVNERFERGAWSNIQETRKKRRQVLTLDNTPPTHTNTSNPRPLLHPTLQRLGYNDISADGASALASLLHAGSSALDSLELQGNHVGDAGAAALANGLAGRGKRGRRDAELGRPAAATGLRSLNLAGNGIGCAGGIALAKALSAGGSGGGGCALEELELAGNAVSLVWLETIMFNHVRFLPVPFFFCGSARCVEGVTTHSSVPQAKCFGFVCLSV